MGLAFPVWIKDGNKMKKIIIIFSLICLLLNFSNFIYADEDSQAKKTGNWFFTALNQWAKDTLGDTILGTIATFLINIKNGLIDFSDKLFVLIKNYLIKLWDFTIAKGDGKVKLGVGDKAANFVNKTLTPIFYAFAGTLIYFFFVLGLFTKQLKNENPIQMFYLAGAAVLFAIIYPYIYSVTIELTNRVAYAIDTKIGESELTLKSLVNNLSVALTGDEQMVSKFLPGNTFTIEDLKPYLYNPLFWVIIIGQILIIFMACFFILTLFLLKGQQVVSVMLAYFLGFIVIPLIIIDEGKALTKWAIGFVNTCLYNFYWILIIVLLYTVTTITFEGLKLTSTNTTTQILLNGAGSALTLFVLFGAFRLMTEVGTIADSLTVGKEITKGAAREFRDYIKMAGRTTALTAGVAGAVGFAYAKAGTGAIGFASGLARSAAFPNVKLPDNSSKRTNTSRGGLIQQLKGTAINSHAAGIKTTQFIRSAPQKIKDTWDRIRTNKPTNTNNNSPKSGFSRYV